MRPHNGCFSVSQTLTDKGRSCEASTVVIPVL